MSKQHSHAVRLKPVTDPAVRSAIKAMRERAEQRLQTRQAMRASGRSAPVSALPVGKNKVS